MHEKIYLAEEMLVNQEQGRQMDTCSDRTGLEWLTS
jgi:hypothetical protein